MFYILFRCTIVISNRLYKFFERIRDGGGTLILDSQRFWMETVRD